jgi:hypothetical protein
MLTETDTIFVEKSEGKGKIRRPRSIQVAVFWAVTPYGVVGYQNLVASIFGMDLISDLVLGGWIVLVRD